MARIRALSQFCLLAAATGCGWQTDEAALTPTRPPAAAVAPMREAAPLEELLALIEQELTAAIDGELQGDAEAALVRAEALTDRLFESRIPFRWIQAEQYSVDARLRQIQSSADRSIAALLSGVPRDTVLESTRALRQDVRALRETLTQGGGPARVPVDLLIQALDTLRTPQVETPPPTPAEAAGTGGAGAPDGT
jgi:hypothetical protein